MKKFIFLAAVLLLVSVFLSGCTLGGDVKDSMSADEAKVFAEEFINQYLVTPENQVLVKEITEINGVYKLVVAFGDDQQIDSYMTKDGKVFFPQAVNVDEKKGENATEDTGSVESTPSPVVNNKNDKPVVELFVMSHCPYGTQVEKGILPVVDALGDKIDFQLKFVDYAMHGQKELNEQLLQYCIQKEQTDKLKPYLYCFLEAEDTNGCLEKTSVNQGQLKNCVASADSEFEVTKKFEEKIDWRGNYPPFGVYAADNVKYGVQGSPALVINGEKISSGRDAQSLLNVVCSAFNTAPEECNNQLDSTTPAPGFGFGGSGSDSAAGCES